MFLDVLHAVASVVFQSFLWIVVLWLWTVALQALRCMGFFQARILEWVAISSSRGSSQPRDRMPISYVSCIGRQVLYHLCHLGSPVFKQEHLNYFYCFLN